MYIHRIVLKDVRSIASLDITLTNEWTDSPLESVLFTGPNGSGKTTLLSSIAALWGNFEEWLQLDIFALPGPTKLEGSRLEALEIRGIDEKPLWLFRARGEDSFEWLKQQADGAYLLGEVIISISDARIEAPKDDEWRAVLNARRQRQVLSGAIAHPLPNMVFLEAESRTIIPPSRDNRDVYPEALYRWLVRYQAQNRWEGHIESMLVNLKVRSEQDYLSMLERINPFLMGKQLTGFDNNLRMQVKVDATGQVHTIDELSAGERQCLIMMFTISRWLQPGGVVLIDEPDLHLHVSLQRHFIHELETLIRDRGGQLIVTSHSPTLWEEYSDRERFELAELTAHG